MGGDERFGGEGWEELEGRSKRLIWSRCTVCMYGIKKKN